MADRFKRIDIQTASLDAALTDFPLYVHVDGDTDIGAVCQSDGTDIYFTASDGSTLLPFERESFAVATGAATGHFWVKTSLATSGTHILLFYGTAEGDKQDAENVWDANFVAVHHLNDATTSTTLDSTSNDNDGAKASANHPVEANGKIAKGQNFDGSADIVNMVYDASLDPTSMTMEALFKSDDKGTGKYHSIITSLEQAKGLIKIYDTDYIQTYYKLSDGSNATAAIIEPADWDAGTWYHIASTIGDGAITIYLNGVSKDTSDCLLDAYVCGSGGTTIGGTPWAGHLFDGVIDEVRISSIARPAAWVKFTSRNILESDHELTWGAEQTTFTKGGGPRTTLGLTLGG